MSEIMIDVTSETQRNPSMTVYFNVEFKNRKHINLDIIRSNELIKLYNRWFDIYITFINDDGNFVENPPNIEEEKKLESELLGRYPDLFSSDFVLKNSSVSVNFKEKKLFNDELKKLKNVSENKNNIIPDDALKEISNRRRLRGIKKYEISNISDATLLNEYKKLPKNTKRQFLEDTFYKGLYGEFKGSSDLRNRIKRLKVVELRDLLNSPNPKQYRRPELELRVFLQEIKKTNIDLLELYSLFELNLDLESFNDNINNNKSGDNCLINFLKIYHTSIKQSNNKTTTHFKNSPKTIASLISFCKLKKIRIKLFNILGDIFFDNHIDTKKKILSGLIYDNHIYNLDSKKPLNIYCDSIGSYKPKTNKTIGKLIKYVTKLKYGWSYYSSPKITPLCYYSDEYRPIDKFIVKDIKNAYLTAFEKLIKHKIIKKIYIQSYKSRWIINSTFIVNEKIYLVNKKSFKKLTKLGYTNNIIYGFEYKFIQLKWNYISGKVYVFDTINSHDTNIIPDYITKGNRQIRKDFKLFYGLCAKTTNKPLHKHALLENIKDVDRELLKFNKYDYKEFDNKLLVEKRSKVLFKNKNLTHIANIIVASCRYIVLNMLYECKKQKIKVHKIKVDSVTTIENVNYPKWLNNIIDIEQANIISKIGKKFIDHVENNEDINDELYKYTENITLILGAPGTGKTQHIRDTIDMDKSINLAYTNTMCKRLHINGKTLHRFYGLNNNMKIKYSKYKNIFVVDEASMIPGILKEHLIISSKVGNNMFIMGDDNQLPPVGEKSYKTIKSFPGAKVINKKIQYRMDKELTDVSNNILNNEKFTFKEYKLSDNLDLDIYLCFTNKEKNYINNLILKNRYNFDLNSYNCFPIGIPLIGKISVESNKIYNGCIYTVLKSDKNNTTLKDEFNIKTIHNTKFLKNNVKFAFARTVYSVQGITLKNKYAIVDYRNMNKIKEQLYVAVTRAKKLNQIVFISSIKLDEDLLNIDDLIEDDFEKELLVQSDELYDGSDCEGDISD